MRGKKCEILWPIYSNDLVCQRPLPKPVEKFGFVFMKMYKIHPNYMPRILRVCFWEFKMVKTKPFAVLCVYVMCVYSLLYNRMRGPGRRCTARSYLRVSRVILFVASEHDKQLVPRGVRETRPRVITMSYSRPVAAVVCCRGRQFGFQRGPRWSGRKSSGWLNTNRIQKFIKKKKRKTPRRSLPGGKNMTIKRSSSEKRDRHNSKENNNRVTIKRTTLSFISWLKLFSKQHRLGTFLW